MARTQQLPRTARQALLTVTEPLEWETMPTRQPAPPATTYARAEFGAIESDFRLCGMDEVGRGALAGPLVAAAVILPLEFSHELVADSKSLSPRQRAMAATVIRAHASAVAISTIEVELINEHGIGWANQEIFAALAEAIDADGYACDGNLHVPSRRVIHNLVGGDRIVPAIAAASIVAKVYRDSLMTRYHHETPTYSWSSNMGYGSPAHLAALRKHGAHPLHRTLFIRNYVKEPSGIASCEAGGDAKNEKHGPDEST